MEASLPSTLFHQWISDPDFEKMFKNLFFKPRIPFDQTNNETKKIVSFVFVRLILEKKKKKKTHSCSSTHLPT